MITITTASAMREYSRAAKSEGKKIGFVPTMGFLHEGHLSLVSMARKECETVVLSIFVNPIQFGPKEDLSRYPRDMERDERLCREAGVDAIFAPLAGDMYPEGFQTTVSVGEISTPLCGASRPGHFDGVATVVLKLFNIVEPDAGFFGQKDFQQLLVIETMARDLNLSARIAGAPIVREPGGLAMSSRNVYLSAEEREIALSLNRSLSWAEEVAKTSVAEAGKIVEGVRGRLEEAGVRVDYVELRDPKNLKAVENTSGGALLALAGFVGKTRLIDNRIIGK
ncbi:pantoate--beta-alanine ligase [bacterium]|nr:MAG: pantoate--beta-alanine ligase [bacterium]